MNGGTRRKDRPEGTGESVSEEAANVLARFVARAAEKQAQAGGLFSIENPDQSYLWEFGPFVKLRSKHLEVVFDQCMFGLCFCDDLEGKWTVKKRTRLLTNSSRLGDLSRLCDGSHVHHTCLGKVRLKGHSYDLARLAGAYPAALCAAWARSLRDELRSWRRDGLA